MVAVLLIFTEMPLLPKSSFGARIENGAVTVTDVQYSFSVFPVIGLVKLLHATVVFVGAVAGVMPALFKNEVATCCTAAQLEPPLHGN